MSHQQKKSKPNSPQVSIIISTYNWPEALSLCIQSILNQSVLPDEIIIADDGSKDETKKLIENFQLNSQVPIQHCWQEDIGFRLAKVRNLALKNVNFPYIIQIDGDIICDKNFVKDHLNCALKNHLVCGRRIVLNGTDTKLTFLNKKLHYTKDSKKINKPLDCIRNPFLMKLTYYEFINKYIRKGIMGCNMAYWLQDALNINGYNENMIGWGKEDDEFMVRILKAGVKKKIIRFGAREFHLEHPFYEKSAINNEIYESTLRNK